MSNRITLHSCLAESLPIIDEQLSKQRVPIYERPLFAAMQFVDLQILEIKGDTKEDYLLRPWFSSIYRLVFTWYKKRYGTGKIAQEDILMGAVKHHGALYVMQFPSAVVTQRLPDGTGWVTFAKEVLDGEDVVSWVKNPPSMLQMKPHHAVIFLKDATNTANKVRSISNHILSAVISDEDNRKMAKSVLSHLSRAASEMCSQDQLAPYVAVWELQMACEMAMKAYLAEQAIAYEKEHDLRYLNNLAPENFDSKSVKKLLSGFPSVARVIKWRYREGDAPGSSELWSFYNIALQVCERYAEQMPRKYTFDNFSVHVARPPWTNFKIPDAGQ